MNIDSVVDFANRAHEDVGKYMIPVTLSPQELMTTEYVVDNITWQSISYGPDELSRVPNDKRGVYAFAICQPSAVLPPHGYILYIGIAGENSNRTLRDRYKDYLSESKILKRPKVARMIGTWHDVLRFFFSPVDNHLPTEELQKLEKQLNTALMPPCSDRDMDAEVRRKRRAFA